MLFIIIVDIQLEKAKTDPAVHIEAENVQEETDGFWWNLFILTNFLSDWNVKCESVKNVKVLIMWRCDNVEVYSA